MQCGINDFICNARTCVSNISLTLRSAELVPIIISELVARSTLATIASEVALISAGEKDRGRD